MSNQSCPLLRGKARTGGDNSFLGSVSKAEMAASDSLPNKGGFPFVKYAFRGAAKEAKWGTKRR